MNSDLLFAGPEFGVWFSVNGGGHWTELRGGLPRIVAAGSRLVLTVTNEQGERVRRLDLPPQIGIHRVTWDLRRDSGTENRPGVRVGPGRYTATLGRLTGTQVTTLGIPQTVLVVPPQR